VGRFFVVCMIAILLIPMAWQALFARAEELVDPMRPEHYQAPASAEKSEGQKVDTTSWSLTAVLSAADRVVAVINGKSLQKGDEFKGYTVMNIQSDHVLLQNREKQLVLHRVGTGLKKNIR
jgi:hypothetical protein